jgi:hypothetical protein
MMIHPEYPFDPDGFRGKHDLSELRGVGSTRL